MEWWVIQELLVTIAIIVGVLVPVFALTYRFVLKPALQGQARLRGEQDHSAQILRDERLDNMERQLEGLEASVQRLVDVTEFDRQLKSGKPPERSP